MSCSKPLTYDSLKYVLQHIEANRRLRLSQHIPSIRAAERATPLKIDYLHMEPLSIKINDTEYSLKAVKTCDDEEFLQDFDVVPRDRTHYDFDEYGMSDDSKKMVALPGEIVVDTDNVLPIGPLSGQAELEQFLRQLLIQKRLERPDMEGQDQLAVEPQVPNENDQANNFNCNLGNLLQRKLLPMRLKEDNAPSPFPKHIEFTVKQNETEKKEHLVNEAKIHEAMKHLMHKILGGRRTPIYVKEFRAPSQRGVLRVPVGLKLKIEHLGVGFNVKKVLERLNPILDEDSFPIRFVKIIGYYHLPEDFQHPVVLNAEKLTVGDITAAGPWQNILQNLPNQEIFWESDIFTDEEMIDFIQHWIQNPRSIGKSFACLISSESFAEEIFPLIQQLPNATLVKLEVPRSENFPNCISIPINDFSELNIYGEDDEHGSWAFKLEVMPRGTAKPLDL